MVTRRALLSTGMTATAVGVQPFEAGAQGGVGDPRLAGVVEALRGVLVELRSMNRGAYTGDFPTGTKLRDAMVPFLRSQQKYPDFVDVGYDVFHQVYDWHVRNHLEMSVGRSPDGRYGIVFQFTRVILRTDVPPDFIGVPYDARP